MPRRCPPTKTLAILVLGLLSVGCTASSAASAPTGAALPAGSSSAPPLTASPTSTAASPVPTERSPAPSTGSPTATGTTADGPPAASLRVEGGDPVVGQVGSYTWAGAGSDSPWLPGARIRVGAGERLSLTLAPATTIGSWTARRVAPGTLDGAGAVSLGEGSGGPIGFAAPGPGAWSVQVAVRFAGELGSATYYWRVEVR